MITPDPYSTQTRRAEVIDEKRKNGKLTLAWVNPNRRMEALRVFHRLEQSVRRAAKLQEIPEAVLEDTIRTRLQELTDQLAQTRFALDNARRVASAISFGLAPQPPDGGAAGYIKRAA